jgi:hypothetical protein
MSREEGRRQAMLKLGPVQARLRLGA